MRHGRGECSWLVFVDLLRVANLVCGALVAKGGMFMKIRCVVTGQTASGKSVIAKDSQVEPVTLETVPGFEFHRVWGGESVPQLPSDGTPTAHPRYFPPAGGYRFYFYVVPPDERLRSAYRDVAASLVEMQVKLPGMAETLDLAQRGMHTTDTVDFDVVISGEVYLQVDDGAEVLLKAGDCVIQNGTRHAWHNRSTENCLVAVAIVGATRGS